MTDTHPLNQAVITQVIAHLRHGLLHHCRAMGFYDDALNAFKNPATLSVLANAGVAWCSVSIDPVVLDRLLHQAQEMVNETSVVDRMLRLGASTEMVSGLYGLTHQEVALRRTMMKLPKRKGRHPALDEQQDIALWQEWKTLSDARQTDLTDVYAVLDVAMDIAESQSIPLAVVWAAIQDWQNQTGINREHRRTPQIATTE